SKYENKDYTVVQTGRSSRSRKVSALVRDYRSFTHRAPLLKTAKHRAFNRRLFNSGIDQRHNFMRSMRTLLAERGKTIARTLRKEREQFRGIRS
ncbi:MAG: hypothetical protein K2X29_14580, partial [Candidatus Obscuribacterales bacterium]|nr:hypothetical protein [Candidatus Obscuribacterales bacterium]